MSKVNLNDCSIIEVVDRISGLMRRIELPFIPDMETFTCACLFENRLFFAKNLILTAENSRIEINRHPTIYIYDLFKETLIGEFPTGEVSGFPQKIVGNQHHVVWWENNSVRCLDLSQNTITTIVEVTSATSIPKVVLNIFENALTILYTEQFEDATEGTWHRKVIDLTDGMIRRDVQYNKSSWGTCFLSNIRMVITDLHNGRPRMYVEDFENSHLSNRRLSPRLSIT